ncbi:unnamed protein product [Haemonchus placei]|uniref:Apple domain-containing protein n=1 Tax=Haemonchus placei TaxID=6290 RepID=A0A0N4WAC1_HAEPC|nr:unnamed protein product [Haemonchus placei]
MLLKVFFIGVGLRKPTTESLEKFTWLNFPDPNVLFFRMTILDMERSMLLLKAVAAPSVWILFFIQVHRALLCTFTIITSEEAPWDKAEVAKALSAQSEGACLKQCLEDFPECFIVATAKVDEGVQCSLFNERSVPQNYVEEMYETYTAGENIYILDRARNNNNACPSADTVLPA